MGDGDVIPVAEKVPVGFRQPLDWRVCNYHKGGPGREQTSLLAQHRVIGEAAFQREIYGVEFVFLQIMVNCDGSSRRVILVGKQIFRFDQNLNSYKEVIVVIIL